MEASVYTLVFSYLLIAEPETKVLGVQDSNKITVLCLSNVKDAVFCFCTIRETIREGGCPLHHPMTLVCDLCREQTALTEKQQPIWPRRKQLRTHHTSSCRSGL